VGRRKGEQKKKNEGQTCRHRGWEEEIGKEFSFHRKLPLMGEDKKKKGVGHLRGEEKNSGGLLSTPPWENIPLMV